MILKLFCFMVVFINSIILSDIKCQLSPLNVTVMELIDLVLGWVKYGMLSL